MDLSIRNVAQIFIMETYGLSFVLLYIVLKIRKISMTVDIMAAVFSWWRSVRTVPAQLSEPLYAASFAKQVLIGAHES